MGIQNLEIKDLLGIIGITIGVFASIFVVFLSEAQVFQIYPNFEVKLQTGYYSDMKNEQLSIENIERIQAKDVKVFVHTDGDLKKTDDSCLEGDFPIQIKSDVFMIEFERMSDNIPCFIDFSNPINTNITLVVITADNSPGRPFIRDKVEVLKYDDTNSTSILNLNDIFSPDDRNVLNTVTKFKELDPGISKFYEILFLIFSVYVATFAIFFAYRQSRKERMRKELEITQKENENQLDRFYDKLDFYEKSIITNPNVEVTFASSIRSLKEKIMTKTNEIDATKSKFFYRPLGHKALDELFVNWRKLEKELIRLGEKKRIYLKDGSVVTLFDTLKGVFPLSDKFITTFQEARNFRNRLTHGQEKTTFGIEDQVKKLSYLLEEIKKIKH